MGAARFELRAQRGFLDEPLDIDRHTGGTVGLELGETMAELRHGAPPVPPAPVIEANADLQDALIEVSHRVWLVDPDSLERLVLLEELLAVELVDPAEQFGRRRIVAARGTLGCGLLEPNAHAGAAAAEARAELPSGDAAGSSK